MKEYFQSIPKVFNVKLMDRKSENESLSLKIKKNVLKRKKNFEIFLIDILKLNY